MNRRIIKIGALALTLVLSVSALCACAGNGDTPSEGQIYTPAAEETVETKGRHTDNSTSTSDYILRYQSSDYTVVVPADNAEVTRSARELISVFGEITGEYLPLVTDDSVTWSDSARYISVGDTALAQNRSVSCDAAFGTDGFRIVTEGKTVFLVGGGNNGVQYACDEFLWHTLGVDWVHPDHYVYDESITDVVLYDYDITEIPDFTSRRAASYRDSDYRLRHWRQQASITEDMIDGDWQHWVHNATYWFMTDDENDISNHPEWAAQGTTIDTDNTEANAVCFNANGDGDSRDIMLEVAFEKVRKALVEGKEGKYIPLSIEDNFARCSCDECVALEEQYGAYSASGLLFLNDLADKVRAWYETEEGTQYADREIQFVWLVYTSTWDCPDVKTFDLDEMVTVWLAPINMDYTKSIYDEANMLYREGIEQWTTLSKKPVLTWFYNTNFYYYMIDYDDYNTIQDLHKFMAQYDVADMWSQGQGASREFAGFYTYKLYLTSKLQWNVNADVNALKERWFNGYFGAAADTMLSWFENMEAWYAHCRTFTETPLGGYRSLYQSVITTSFYPRYVVRNWLSYAEQAFEDIAYLKDTNAERYSLIYDRICRVRLSPLYILNELYASDYSDADLKELRRTFYQDAVRTQVDLIKEHDGELLSYVQGWDI